MNGITDLFKSERGVIGLALLVGATVLAALGHMPLERWEHFSLLVFGVYVAGKSATGVAALLTSRPARGAAFDDMLTKVMADVLPELVKSFTVRPLTPEQAQAEVDLAAALAVGIPATAPEPATPVTPATP